MQRLLLLAQVFITDVRATKKQIKNAVLRLYDIQTKRINTLVRCPETIGIVFRDSVVLVTHALSGDPQTLLDLSPADLNYSTKFAHAHADASVLPRDAQARRLEEGVRAAHSGLRRPGRGKQDWHHLGCVSNRSLDHILLPSVGAVCNSSASDG